MSPAVSTTPSHRACTGRGCTSFPVWILALVNSAPYLCCATIGCWLKRSSNRLFGGGRVTSCDTRVWQAASYLQYFRTLFDDTHYPTLDSINQPFQGLGISYHQTEAPTSPAVSCYFGLSLLPGQIWKGRGDLSYFNLFPYSLLPSAAYIRHRTSRQSASVFTWHKW
jgi:hypothetical protein